ncbi:hypothetical protein ACFC09_24885 [Streptomyces sp. NPDC056161]|uniref:hypothetical protein n=1 Tax=Streptomyces sp. NPDC056161 TaxID=3345732 RepID=UPI0035E14494
MERELDWLVGKLLEMPDAQRELQFPGCASRESLRSYLLALREQSPDAYRRLVDRMRTTGRPAPAPERWFPPRPDSVNALSEAALTDSTLITDRTRSDLAHPDLAHSDRTHSDPIHSDEVRPETARSKTTYSETAYSKTAHSETAHSDTANGSTTPGAPADALAPAPLVDTRAPAPQADAPAPQPLVDSPPPAPLTDTPTPASPVHHPVPASPGLAPAPASPVHHPAPASPGLAPAPASPVHDPAPASPIRASAPAPSVHDPAEAFAQDHGSARPADHVDFRDATFHGQVVGVQYLSYPAAPGPATGQWGPVDEADPVWFGVRPTRLVPGLPEVPPYVPRDCDAELGDLLGRGGLVVVLGEPCAGKSYTAWNAVRSLAAEGYLLHAADPHDDLRRLPGELKDDPGKRVLWLDELSDHLGAGGLDRRLLQRFTGRGVVVLGTMSAGEYYRRRSGTGPAESVLALARTVELAREWSEAELERLAGHTDDPRAYPAYLWSGREGAASYFAIGHLLYDEWQRLGTQAEHPRGRLLVRAAVDLVRCGVTEAVSVELLVRAAAGYPAHGAEREPFEAALTWATAPMFGISGLLVAGEKTGTWRAYGALVAEALRSGGLSPVPDDVWWTLLGDREVDRAAVLDAARASLRARVDGGDIPVIMRFASLTEGAEREDWYRRAADLGHQQAALQLATLLLRRGDDGQAIPYLEVAARRGVAEAARQLAVIYEVRARYWWDRSRSHLPAPDTVEE